MDTENALKNETEKWLAKLEQKAGEIKLLDPKGAWAMENIKAYMSDCRHFYKAKDFVKSFEAVVYAYGIYETALNSGLIS